MKTKFQQKIECEKCKGRFNAKELVVHLKYSHTKSEPDRKRRRKLFINLNKFQDILPIGNVDLNSVRSEEEVVFTDFPTTDSFSDSSSRSSFHSISSNIFNSAFVILKNKINNFVENENKKNINRLILFYNEARPLNSDILLESSLSEVVIGHDGSTTFSKKSQHCKSNEMNCIKKRFERITNSYNKENVKQITISAGPMLNTFKSIEISSGKCTIYYRPFMSLISNLLNDSSINEKGILTEKPILLNSNYKYGSYASSSHFRKTFEYISKTERKKNILVFPICLWSDGVSISTSRNKYSSFHPLVVGFPTLSNISPDLGVSTKLLAFLFCDTQISNANEITNSILRQQLMSKSLFTIISEIKAIQEEHGFESNICGNKKIIYPYVSYFIQDSKEANLIFNARRCSMCDINNQQLHCGNRFDDDSFLNEITKVETEQEKMLENNLEYTTLKRHHKFYISNDESNYKPIRTFDERIKFPKALSISSTVDFMHCINLGLIKWTITRFYSSVNPSKASELERLLRTIPNFPISFISISKSLTGVASDFSTCLLLLQVIITGKLYCHSVEDQESFVNIFDCLGLLLVYGSKQYITKKDYKFIIDGLNALDSLIPVDEAQRNVFHLIKMHLFQPEFLAKYGAPVNYSTSKYERGLSRLKRSITRASNHHNEPLCILKRALNGELLKNATLISSSSHNIFTTPCYQLMIIVDYNKIDIGYCDTERCNQYDPVGFIKLQSKYHKIIKSRSAIIEFMDDSEIKYGLINKIIVKDKDKDMHRGLAIINNFVKCKFNVHPLIEDKGKLKFAPHQELWKAFYQSSQEIEVDIKKVIGSCYSFDSNGITWISNSNASSMIINGKTQLRLPFEQ